MPTSPVTAAMAERREPKEVIRAHWVEAVREVAKANNPEGLPLYLTLPGELGLDIRALMDANLVQSNEVGGVAEGDAWKVVAVEKSQPAVGRLLDNIPGLRVLKEPVQALLHGEGLTAWPSGARKAYLRALVVNLDLTEPLKAAVRSDADVTFPVIEWIRKIAILHQEGDPVDWTLCLTLNGGVALEGRASDFASRTLRDNLKRDAEFHDLCSDLLGQQSVESCLGCRPLKDWALTIEGAQTLIMALVPKMIARSVYGAGWRITGILNARYGGEQGAAPMVSWILRFEWDPACRADPERVYREAIRSAAGVAQTDPL